MYKDGTFLKRLCLCVVLFGAIMVSFCGGRNAYAVNKTATVQKAYFSALERCYQLGAFQSPLTDVNGGWYKIVNSVSNASVFLPAGSTNAKNNTIGCRNFIFGGLNGWVGNEFLDSDAGLFGLYGKSNDSEKEKIKGLGYVTNPTQSGNNCIEIDYTYTDNTNGTKGQTSSNSICATLNGDNVASINVSNSQTSIDGKSPISFSLTRKNKIEIKKESGFVCSPNSSFSNYTTNNGVGSSWSDLKNEIMTNATSNCDRASIKNGTGSVNREYEVVRGWADGDGGSDYIISNKGTAFETALNYFSNGRYTKKSDLNINNKDLYVYYLELLTEYYYGGVGKSSYWICDVDWANYGSFSKQIVVSPSGGRSNNCRINLSATKDGITSSDRVSGFVSSNGTYSFDASGSTSYDLPSLVDAINQLAGGLSASDMTSSMQEVDNSSVTSGADPDASKDKCGSGGAAKSLGWLVCPILNWMGEAAEGIYNDYVKPNLEIEPQLFNNTNGAGTREGWNVFQGIANVIFIILMLVVIFSQITGIGIDNYGIKRILPRMIVVAILANLSYYICIACVDLSNIIGNGIQAIFNELPPTDYSGVIAGGSAVGSTIASVGILGGIFAGSIAMIWTNPAVLLSLLVSVIGIMIAMFFLFVLLVAREATIVVLVVISPLAIVCYMLPNTKRYFDRFVKIAEGLLLVYPICGLLVGGGDYVSRLLLKTGMANQGTFGALVPMVVGIIPIFFLPTVLKNSFSAMGNIGAKITGFGERLRGGTERRLRSSEIYKNAQELGDERRTRIRAGLDRSGNARNLGNVGKLLRGGNRSMARARSQYLRNQDMKNRTDSLMGVGFDAAVIGQAKRAEKDQSADYMTLINDRTRNGEDRDALYALYMDYLNKGNKAGAVAIARIAGRRKDTAADFLAGILNGEYRDNDGNRRAMTNVTDTNPKLLAAIMKEIATGDNSGAYRSSAPLGFDFAAQYNSNYAEDANGNPVSMGVADYGVWSSRAENVDGAVNRYITNAQELVGVKGSSLREIKKLMDSGTITSDESNRLKSLATSVIENRNKPGAVWDTTKAKELCDISGKYELNVKGEVVPKTTTP